VLLTITLTHIVTRGKKSFKRVLKFFMKLDLSKGTQNTNELSEEEFESNRFR